MKISPKEVYTDNRRNGFWDGYSSDNEVYFVAAKLALLFDELTESSEAVTVPEYFEEMADIAIRSLDLLGFFGGQDFWVVPAKNIDDVFCVNLKWKVEKQVAGLLRLWRNGVDDTASMASHLKDLILCLLDYQEIAQAYLVKLDKNKHRPYKHGKRF